MKSWLKRNAPDNKMLDGWIDDYFYKAVELVTNQLELVVPTTLVGVILGGLSHLRGVSSRGEFACAVIRGLGGNLSEAAKETLAKEVCLSQKNLSFSCLFKMSCRSVVLWDIRCWLLETC